jgi:hypothetical protein
MASRAGARVKRAALNLRLRICVLGARRIPAKDSSRTLRIPDHYRAKDFPGTCLADSFSPTNQKIRTRPIRPLLWPGSNRERWMRLAAWPCCVTSDGPSSNRSLTPQGCWQTTSTESRLNGQPEYSRRHTKQRIPCRPDDPGITTAPTVSLFPRGQSVSKGLCEEELR